MEKTFFLIFTALVAGNHHTPTSWKLGAGESDPSKWWGAFIVIDKMGSWHPWAESVGLGEEIGMMKVFKCLFSWTATDSPLGLRPIGIGRVSAVYVFSCRQQRFLINHQTLVVYKPRGGGYPQKNWVGVCGPLPKTLTLFMTKICDFLYPIYDLTKNLIPYLWPDP